MPRLKKLGFLLRNDLQHFNNDNLHLVAISNLDDGERTLRRWWEDKYKRPVKDFEDHTVEELLISMYEDYYRKNPSEIQRFLDSVGRDVEPEWDGRMPSEHEKAMKERLSNKPKLDLSKWQTEGELTEEEEKRILDSLGRNLPKSKRVVNMNEGGEFDEDFDTLGSER